MSDKQYRIRSVTYNNGATTHFVEMRFPSFDDHLGWSQWEVLQGYHLRTAAQDAIERLKGWEVKKVVVDESYF